MATFLDVGLLSYFSAIFTFLFLFVLLYGLLSSQKMLKLGEGGKGIYALIALSVSFIAVLSGGAISFIGFLTPWFTALIILMFFIFFIFKMWVGDDDSFFQNAIKNNRGLQWTLIVASILIMIAALSNSFGQNLLEQNPEFEGATVVDGTQQVQVQARPPASGQILDTYQEEGDVGSEDFGGNVLATFVHPRVLGMIMILLVAFFSILLLARSNDPNNM